MGGEEDVNQSGNRNLSASANSSTAKMIPKVSRSCSVSISCSTELLTLNFLTQKGFHLLKYSITVSYSQKLTVIGMCVSHRW